MSSNTGCGTRSARLWRRENALLIVRQRIWRGRTSGCVSPIFGGGSEILDQRVTQTIRLRLSQARGTLTPLEAHLGQLSPLKILDRGYAIVEHKGAVVKSPSDAPVGSELRVRLALGDLAAKVVAPKKK